MKLDYVINERNYTEEEIRKELFISRGNRRVTFRYDLLDKNDIKIGELDSIQGKISFSAFAQIKRTATFQLNEYLQKNINYLSDRVQPFFTLHMPDRGIVEFPLGIFLLSSPKRKINGKIKEREIVAYDKSIIIDEDKFTARYYIPAGTNYAGAITKILTSSNITKINIEGTDLTLKNPKEFEIGYKVKQAVNDLLNEINYNSIDVDELGYFYSKQYIEPGLRQIDHTYSADNNSIISPEFTEELDIAGRANVFTRAVTSFENDTELVSTFINDNPLSPTSTVNRGRQIVDFEVIENIATQETLDNYVRRIAMENSSAYSKLSFSTAIMPTHGNQDTLYINVQNLFDTPLKFNETSWEMPLDNLKLMTHEARKVVQL